MKTGVFDIIGKRESYGDELKLIALSKMDDFASDDRDGIRYEVVRGSICCKEKRAF